MNKPYNKTSKKELLNKYKSDRKLYILLAIIILAYGATIRVFSDYYCSFCVIAFTTLTSVAIYKHVRLKMLLNDS